MKKDKNTEFMKLAIKLAKKAEGMTSPNPLVGAVLVKKGKIIGSGYHKKAGLPHAEIEAFKDAKKRSHNIKGSTLYVNLEPCCHDGKRTPPCTDAIIENKVAKVFVGVSDPNPRVRGKGIRILRKAGIDVQVGLLKKESEEINKVFFKYIKQKMPYVVLKLASTLDGKIATKSGDSKWIGSQKQREIAHHLRNKMDSVLVGVNTVINDNPSLNVRINRRNISQPVPVILDSRLRTPLNSNLFKVHDSCIIVTSKKSSKNKRKQLEQMGAKVLYSTPDKNGNLKLKPVLKKLSMMEISTVLIEGGSKVASSALNEGIVDRIVLFYSPKIVGGDGLSMISGLGIINMKNALNFKEIFVKKFGNELMIEAEL